jgi:hypothetical protein
MCGWSEPVGVFDDSKASYCRGDLSKLSNFTALLICFELASQPKSILCRLPLKAQPSSLSRWRSFSTHLTYSTLDLRCTAAPQEKKIKFLMKTAEPTELTASEMETVSGGAIQNGIRKPKLGKLIVFLLLLLLKKHRDSAPTPERMQEV